ncbi:MAG: ATP-dependent metallopeptidase FtsH/Yme1/Tma family protein [Chloroflexota bacterium]
MRPKIVRRVTAAARRRPRTTLAVVAIAVAVTFGVAALMAADHGTQPPSPAGPSFTYDGSWDLLTLQRMIDAGEVAAVSAPDNAVGADVDAGTLLAKTRTGQLIRVPLTITTADAAQALASLGHSDLLTAEAWQAIRTGRAAVASPSDPVRTIASILFPFALLIVLVVVLARAMRPHGSGLRDQGSSFTTIVPKSRDAAATAATDPPGVQLDDVAGCSEAKMELVETIEFLKDPVRFHRLGARIPRGIMLFGPPGTGKTMLAKAVANEAGVPFLYASGSEFVEKYVGVGARRIRDLFAQARKLGRAVIFFDEFDAVGKARGGQNSHEEREQTLNQLLVELDGFATTDDIVVIAATNRLDVLDPAVLRPGRFNRKIHVGLPDVKGRREILDVHARNKPIATVTDLDGVARKTYGFSGAQLADLLNEAAILAARRSADAIGPDDLHNGWLKVAVGTSRRRSMDERERSIIAAHEVGHGICGRVHGDKRRVEEISLFAHGEALGVTVSSQEDNDLPSESDLRARLIALMGGRAAEELLFHEVTAGASNDFEKANQIATTMVTKFGMGQDPESRDVGTSGRGSLSFLVARPNGGMPTEVQAAATRAIRAILDEAYETATETLVEHIETLRRLAAYLVEHERVDGETFEEVFAGRIEVPNALSEWRPEASRPRDWGEILPFRDRRLNRPRLVTSSDRSGEVAAAAQIQSDEEPAADALDATVAASIVTVEPVALDAPVVVEAEPAPKVIEKSRSVSGATPRRPSRLRRRARRTAAGWLHAAEGWVRPGEPEVER